MFASPQAIPVGIAAELIHVNGAAWHFTNGGVNNSLHDISFLWVREPFAPGCRGEKVIEVRSRGLQRKLVWNLHFPSIVDESSAEDVLGKTFHPVVSNGLGSLKVAWCFEGVHAQSFVGAEVMNFVVIVKRIIRVIGDPDLVIARRANPSVLDLVMMVTAWGGNMVFLDDGLHDEVSIYIGRCCLVCRQGRGW